MIFLGIICKGDEVMVLFLWKISKVKEILIYDGEVEEVFCL